MKKFLNFTTEICNKFHKKHHDNTTIKHTDFSQTTTLHSNLIEIPVFRCPEYKRLSEYGYIRTIADIIKVLNQSNCYTNPETLIHDLQTVLDSYIERGTVSHSSIDAFSCLINNYSEKLFVRNKLDINKLAYIIDKIPSQNITPIDEVFSIRQKAKILYAIEFANKICKYTNPNHLVSDLCDLFYGMSTWGWHTKLLDDNHPHTNYGVRLFLENITKIWSSITSIDSQSKVATLNNDLLESYMFTDHENKIRQKGLVSTLNEDYEKVPGCYSTRLMPIQSGSGPIYVISDNNQIQKACHPSDDTLLQQEFYEKGFISILIRNLIKRNEYQDIEGVYYIPVSDYSRPIYDRDYNEMSFEDNEQKFKFIQSLR